MINGSIIDSRELLLTLWILKPLQIIYTHWPQNLIHSSQKTHCFSSTKSSQSILRKEIICVHYENLIKQMNTVLKHNTEFVKVTAVTNCVYRQ